MTRARAQSMYGMVRYNVITDHVWDHQAGACRMCGIPTRVVQFLLCVHMGILMAVFRAFVRY